MITKIKEDIKQARFNKETARLSTLKLLLAELELEKVKFKLNVVEDLKKEQVMTVINRTLKALDKEIVAFQDAGRDVEKQESEKALLIEYLPKQLTTDEINAEVVHALDLVDKGELADVNKAKAYLAQKLKGKADMAKVMGALAKYNK